MEVTNYLLGYKNLKIIQNTEWFNFSLDSVLLANFVTIRSNTRKIVDLGTGNAPIPLILSTKTKAKIYGIEIQKELYELAIRSVQINNLDEKIQVLNDDAKKLDNIFDNDTIDVITVNPPYFKANGKSLMNINNCKTIARHEVMLEIDDVLHVAKKILRNNGILGIVHRPERLIEILDKMHTHNIEPKRIRFVYSKSSTECNLVLIEGTKNGNEGLKILPPLFVYDDKGNYTDEVRKMFGE
ncbi:MAG: tRNA1(Val) (adenine(37)-N6)-methyltransferase [Bacilli bacterium]|jgi:tRNA1(Val) A37 N6-methylase TrmN6